MKIQDILLTVLGSILLLLTSCCKETANEETSQTEGATVRVQMMHPDHSTRAYLESGSDRKYATGIRWNNDEKVKLFARQNEQIVDLGECPLQDISSDGKVAFVEFRMPGQVDLSKPYELYGITPYFDTKIERDAAGKEVVRGTFTADERYEWAGGLSVWRKVPWCFETTVNQSVAIVEVKQLAAYQFICLTSTAERSNTYMTKVEADDCWFYKTFHVQFPGTIVTGENEGFIEGNFRYHDSDEVSMIACYSIILPNGKKPTNVRFHFNIGKKDYVTPARSSNVDLHPGNAYYFWLLWDGTNLTFDKNHPGNEATVNDGKLDDVPGFEL